MDNNLVGQIIQGRYYIVSQLGRGGVGVTFLAEDRQCFNSPCVVKQLKPKLANAKTLEIARRLFNREAEIMNRLGDCDRIPRLLAYFEHNQDFFLVQELVEGHDLSQEIIAGQPWSADKAIALLKDILEVLMFVQQNNVIHRDLKPSNLMRGDRDKKIILIDFGSVKQISTQIINPTGKPNPTVAVGTRSYMPIEQMMGHPGFYSDIYAVGVIIIQALTGVHPRNLTVDEDNEIIWRNKLDHQVNYQPRFLDILDTMVRRRHQQRYTSAQGVLSDLEQLGTLTNNDKATILVANSTSSHSPRKVQAVGKIERETKTISSQSSTCQNAPHSLPTRAKSKKSKFKTILAIACVPALLAAVSGGWVLFQKFNSQPKFQLSLYKNLDQGFQVDYPEPWLKQNRDDFFTTGVVFLAPLDGDRDKFKEQVSVLVENLSGKTSLAEYTDESIAEIKKLSDPKVGDAQTVDLGGREGRQVVYHGEENGYPVERMQAWLVKNNQAYIFTYTAQPENYDSYLPTVEKMIESFTVISN